MDKYKAKLLDFIKSCLADQKREGEQLEIVYWTTDRFGLRIAEIGGHTDHGNGCKSGWAIMDTDQDGLHLVAACERLLLYYILVETDPDDGYAGDVEDYQDMVRSLLLGDKQ